jgi:hypothetical protein
MPEVLRSWRAPYIHLLDMSYTPLGQCRLLHHHHISPHIYLQTGNKDLRPDGTRGEMFGFGRHSDNHHITQHFLGYSNASGAAEGHLDTQSAATEKMGTVMRFPSGDFVSLSLLH